MDFETEILINNLINQVKEINNIERKIKFKIISNKNINAFVDANNIITFTSGLIENSPDYVAFLSVLAHEVGHIDLQHIHLRKNANKKIGVYKEFSNLSIIAGSLISQNPELLKSLSVNTAGLSNLILVFSKDQEYEADYYSIKTLNKLNKPINSTIDLIEIIEKEALEKGLDEDMQARSTHPLFKERKKIIKLSANNKKNTFDNNLDNQFQFIRGKFLGYSGNINIISSLKQPYKKYSESILFAKNGELKKSLTILNELIDSNRSNYFLLETKADILHSYGYTNESIKFYKKVLQKYKNNKYAQIRIFHSIDLDILNKQELNQIFDENYNLLTSYFYNKKMLTKYLILSKKLEKKDWINFLNYWLNEEKKDINSVKVNLLEFKKTDNKQLYNLINLIYKEFK